jgi:hypothetical protein
VRLPGDAWITAGSSRRSTVLSAEAPSLPVEPIVLSKVPRFIAARRHVAV